MSPGNRKGKWIRENRDDRSVRVWLAEHEPPADWEGSRMEWAYNSMPQPHRVLAVGGALALLGLGVWYFSRRRQPKAPTLFMPEIEGPALRRVARTRYGS